MDVATLRPVEVPTTSDRLAKTPSAHSPFTSYRTAISTVRVALSPALQDASGAAEER